MAEEPAERDELAATFRHPGVAGAYRHRPPYPAEVFDILERIITDRPRRVLDIGAGLLELAGQAVTTPTVFRQPVADYVEQFHSTASLARGSAILIAAKRSRSRAKMAGSPLTDRRKRPRLRFSLAWLAAGFCTESTHSGHACFTSAARRRPPNERRGLRSSAPSRRSSSPPHPACGDLDRESGGRCGGAQAGIVQH